MSLHPLFAALWPVASTFGVLSDIRAQMRPCIALLAPNGATLGCPRLAFGVFSFAAMLCKQLIHFARKAMGASNTDPRKVAP